MGTISIRPMIADDKPAVMSILRNTPEFMPHEVTIAEELIDAFLRDSVSYRKHGFENGFIEILADAAHFSRG